MKFVNRTRIVFGILRLAILPTPILAQQHPQSVSFGSKQGSLIVQMDNTRYQITSGKDNWDWLPTLSPKGSFVAFLRQPKGKSKVVHLGLIRLKDGKEMILRTGKYGVAVSPYKTLTLRWKDSNTLILAQGKQSSSFDLRGRKLDSIPSADKPARELPSVNFRLLEQRALAQQKSN